MTTQFEGCCGAVIWYLGGSDNSRSVEREIKYLITPARSQGYSIGLVILTESQKATLHKLMLSYKFRKVWGPIKNQNTGNNLYGYMLNINTYKSKTLERKRF